MKKTIISESISAFLLMLAMASCTADDRDRVYYPFSVPEISEFSMEPETSVIANDSIYFSIKINDEKTPLSTLEVSFLSPHAKYSKTVRTKGNSFSLAHQGIFIPFNIGLEDGEKGTLTVRTINVEGGESTAEKEITIRRPEIGKVLYFNTASGASIELHLSSVNPFEYISAYSFYDSSIKGKIMDSPQYKTSHYVWGGGEKSNYATIITQEDEPDITFSYPEIVVTNIKFNALTFTMDASGISNTYVVNGRELKADGDYFSAEIDFKQGEKVTFMGFDGIENAYNRDFIHHDKTTGEYTFLRASGKWKVSYYKPFNYMWISRSSDVAPECFWMVGHGFTCSPVWNSFYENTDGWNLEDIKQEAYVVKTGDHTYQCTVYLSNKHKWNSFEAEFYSDKAWGKDRGMVIHNSNISGDKTGIVESKSNGITSGADFVPGYYQLTFDTSAGVGKEKLSIKRISE